MTRSALFARALEEFVRRSQNQELLRRINSAYGGVPDESERALHAKMVRLQRRVVKEKR